MKRVRQIADPMLLCSIRYREALAASPQIASTYSAIGFTYHLKGDLNTAIELYHQSLSLKPDDTFTSGMLSEALKELIEIEDDPTFLTLTTVLAPELGEELLLNPAEQGFSCMDTSVM